jgi:hypothetical protein
VQSEPPVKDETPTAMSATCLEKLMRANRWRVRTGKYASEDSAGWNGVFLVPIDGEIYNVMIGDGMGFRHLSVTNAQKKKLPDWTTMCRLKDMFFSEDSWVVQYHPPKEEHVNFHPFCLHLWESIDEPMPHPEVVQV